MPSNPNFVVANAASDFGAGPLSVPLAGMPASGSVLVMTRCGVAGAAVTDGASYVQVLTDVSDTFGDFVSLFKRIGAPSGTNNPSLTVPTGSAIYIEAVGYDSGDITGTPVLNAQFAPAAGLNNAFSGNTTPLLPNATIVGFSYDSGNSITPTAGTSPIAFTNRVISLAAFGLEDFAQTTAAAIQATFGYTSGNPVTVVAALANSAGGGNTAPINWVS